VIDTTLANPTDSQRVYSEQLVQRIVRSEEEVTEQADENEGELPSQFM
jgi:hypothetical protein